MSLTFKAQLFYGIDFGETVLHDEDLGFEWETKWQQRHGKPPDAAARLIAIGAETTPFHLYAYATASFVEGGPWGPKPFAPLAGEKAWRESLRALATGLDLPWREPRWMLVNDWSP